ncbi:MAG: Crp/Fnr family transcriptional regulator [Eubacteriales bacterium]|nr:Crp/Fnr family transcriptional regulator [Eubacteriales bacterium]
MNKNQFLDYFQNFSFWEHMSEADKELLLSNIRTLHYEEGAAIQSGEQQCLGTLFLLKGIMRVYLLSAQGKEATLYRLRAGDICTLSASCMLSAITFDVQIDAETDCELLLLPAPVFSRLMKNNIYLESFIYKLTAEHFSDVISGIERTFFLSLPQRIAAFLLDEAAETGSDILPLTKESLARSIGSAREAVSRALKQMASEGCIEVSRGNISIRNKSRLYQMLNPS